MLNLLKRERRYEIRTEYFGRFLNIILLVLIFSIAYYCILLVSNSFFVSVEKKIVENESLNILLSSSQQDLKSYEDALNHLEGEYNLFSKKIAFPTDFISIIDSKKMAGVNLTSISFQKINDKEEVALEIKGVAQNRDTLVRYSNSFKEDQRLTGISLPVSTLAKSSDIPFALSFNSKIEIQNEN